MVPQVYFVNHNGTHVVGAPFVLMERLGGQPLCKLWAELTLEHRKVSSISLHMFSVSSQSSNSTPSDL